MPFYEYQASDLEHSCEHCFSPFDVMQSIHDDPLVKCPECGAPVQRLISQLGGIIILSRAANQYNDIRKAKYWRDHNGVRHKVTDADGYSHSPTPSRRQTRSPEEVAAIKRRDAALAKRRREIASYRRYVEQIKRQKRS